MEWKKTSPKLIKSLVHRKQYLLAYQYGDKWSYAIDTWCKWNKKDKGHFALYILPKMIAEIEEPETINEQK